MLKAVNMDTHRVFEPAIHYWGTPVVLLSTRNEDGSTNVAPMSSIWWLGWSAMLGLDATSKTVENLRRDRECVINLCDAGCADAVNLLARTTGSDPVPLHKRALGYTHVDGHLLPVRVCVPHATPRKRGVLRRSEVCRARRVSGV